MKTNETDGLIEIDPWQRAKFEEIMFDSTVLNGVVNRYLKNVEKKEAAIRHKLDAWWKKQAEEHGLDLQKDIYEVFNNGKRFYLRKKEQQRAD